MSMCRGQKNVASEVVTAVDDGGFQFMFLSYPLHTDLTLQELIDP